MLELAYDAAVTLAGSGFQPNSIHDCDSAIAVADEFRLLEQACRDSDTGLVHAKHDRRELLRHRKCIAMSAMVSGQQPTGETLIQRVTSIEGRGLRNLSLKRQGIAQQQLAKDNASILFFLKGSCAEPEECTRRLDYGFGCSAVAAEQKL